MDDVIRGSLDYLPRQLCKDFVRQYRITLTYSQVWNMKERSKERIHGIPQFLYKLLSWLCDYLFETNLRPVAKFKCDEDRHFLQLFVVYAVSIHGFEMGCRSIIVIDLSHMIRKVHCFQLHQMMLMMGCFLWPMVCSIRKIMKTSFGFYNSWR